MFGQCQQEWNILMFEHHYYLRLCEQGPEQWNLLLFEYQHNPCLRHHLWQRQLLPEKCNQVLFK